MKNSKRSVKKVIDGILTVLFALLLGYSFTGGNIHEILGIGFLVMLVIHNLLNIKYYTSLRKGDYNFKRKLTFIINTALIVDSVIIGVTGIINSRYLFNTDIHIANIGQIHMIASLVGFVLIVYHIFIHALAHSKKEYKKLPVIIAAAALIVALILGLFGLPYVKRHFNTVKIEYRKTVSGETVDFGDKNILTVYFTRVGNSVFEEDVDAVSGASLMLTEEDRLMGNSQLIADMIHDAVDGDEISINTKDKYPSSYYDTISVAGKEKDCSELPQLIDMPESIEEYDTVFLVYPLWWWSIPKPVEVFLSSYDFSGKTIYPVVTHGGSGTGDSLEEIKAACNGSVLDDVLEVYCDDVPDCRDDVTKWLKGKK